MLRRNRRALGLDPESGLSLPDGPGAAGPGLPLRNNVTESPGGDEGPPAKPSLDDMLSGKNRCAWEDLPQEIRD